MHGAAEGSGTNRPLAFSAIGRVESLASDVLDIARHYGAVESPALPVAVAARVHSHAANACSNIEMTQSIMHKLCFLYAVDYACLPVYRRPLDYQLRRKAAYKQPSSGERHKCEMSDKPPSGWDPRKLSRVFECYTLYREKKDVSSRLATGTAHTPRHTQINRNIQPQYTPRSVCHSPCVVGNCSGSGP